MSASPSDVEVNVFIAANWKYKSPWKPLKCAEDDYMRFMKCFRKTNLFSMDNQPTISKNQDQETFQDKFGDFAYLVRDNSTHK